MDECFTDGSRLFFTLFDELLHVEYKYENKYVTILDDSMIKYHYNDYNESIYPVYFEWYTKFITKIGDKFEIMTIGSGFKKSYIEANVKRLLDGDII